MDPFTVLLSPSPTETRLLATRGGDELVRACLPPPLQVRHWRAMPTLLEGLALLLTARPRVVLCVDAQDAASCLGLTDALGIEYQSVYYDLEVISRRPRPHGRRLRGVARFTDLHRLRLVAGRKGV
jgi:hypothetical protein